MAFRKWREVVASGLLLGLVVVIFLIFRDSLRETARSVMSVSSDSGHADVKAPLASLPLDKASQDVIHQRIKERNQVSRMLNDMKSQMGQMECNMAKLQNQHVVSSSGGYCEQDSDPKHRFDVKMADVVGEFFTGQRVGGFGDGPVQYKAHLLKQGRVAAYDDYDGAPFVEKVTGGDVKFMDLTLPQYGLPAYDWVMCLEVAEHIPARYERVVVDNIVRYARKGAVLSWGKIGQGDFITSTTRAPRT